MRLYLKLIALIAIFGCASRWQLRQTMSDLAYDARVAFVCAFGSASDYQALIDDTQEMLARERGNLDLYLKGQRCRQLLDERLAAATRLNMAMSETDLERIRTECTIAAFGGVEYVRATDSEMESTASAALEGGVSRLPVLTANNSGW